MSEVASEVRRRSLDALFTPRSVVVVGASAEPGKWGYRVAEQLLRGEHRRRIYLVNRKGGEIHGRSAHRSLAELPEPPDLAILCVPNAGFEEAVTDALAAGVKAFVAITAGFAETGPEGRARERAIVDRVRESGAVLIGPNCLGIYDAGAELECLPWSNPAPGPIGIVSQSGTVINDLDARLRAAGLGFSRAVSIGNQADLTVADLLRSFGEHEETGAICIYCEDFRDGRETFGAAFEAVEAGTPVVVLGAGWSASAARAAYSHTGALVSDRETVRAACRASGAVLVDSLREAADALQMLLSGRYTSGRRVAAMSEGGGMTVLAADAVNAVGLETPVLSDDLSARIASELAPGATTSNPIDMVGIITIDPMVGVMRRVAASEEVDAVLAAVADFTAASPEEEVAVVNRIADAADEGGKPVAISAIDPSSWGARTLRERGYPVYQDIDAAARGLALVCGHKPARGLPLLPPPVPADDEDSASYFGARALLEREGVRFGPSVQVRTLEEALGAAAELGYPVVLKALGALHKSDAGGVVLDISDEAAFEQEFRRVERDLAPPSWSVEPMLSSANALDLIVGTKRDPRFGPVILVGTGGIYTEILRDTSVALAPVGLGEAVELVESLAAAPLLAGARGEPKLDVRAAAEVAATLSGLAASRPDLVELEINPLRVLREGAVALDARVLALPTEGGG